MQVRDMKAARAVDCFVILKGSRYVAKVQVHRSAAGVVQVDVWQEREAAERSLAAALKAGVKAPKLTEYQRPYGYQSARAGGGGYDKFTAALSGMWIDGHELTDHCGKSLKPPKGAGAFPADFKAPKGYSLANPCVNVLGYRSCYKMAGLRYLEALGYTVIEGI